MGAPDWLRPKILRSDWTALLGGTSHVKMTKNDKKKKKKKKKFKIMIMQQYSSTNTHGTIQLQQNKQLNKK